MLIQNIQCFGAFEKAPHLLNNIESSLMDFFDLVLREQFQLSPFRFQMSMVILPPGRSYKSLEFLTSSVGTFSLLDYRP